LSDDALLGGYFEDSDAQNEIVRIDIASAEDGDDSLDQDQIPDEFDASNNTAESATEKNLWNNMTNDAVFEELASFYRRKIQ